jgi:hypothetical protein
MADSNSEAFNSEPESTYELEPTGPRKRTDYVRPQKELRQFDDGTSKSQPSKNLKDLVKKVLRRHEYQPLLPDEDIRVLILKKGKRTEPMRCMLRPTPLPSAQGGTTSIKTIKYEALSYYWGEDKPNIEITISTYNPKAPLRVDQKQFWIRPNLYAALVQLRHEDYDVPLWVDAICIHQEDKIEKTAQVSRMHEIYSESENVCIWLGEGESKSNRKMFDFIRAMLNLRRLDQLVLDESHADQWYAFVRLMRNRWFSRRWVVQELALAKEATVHYGQETLQWMDFRDAVALFVTKHDQIKRLLSQSRYMAIPDPVGDMRALGANTLVEATSNLFRRSDKGKIVERLLDLETLVSTFLAFEAKDPRDTVYGVLSIAKDTPYSDPDTTAHMASSGMLPGRGAVESSVDLRITPNYNKSLADLCTDFIEYCVEKSRSLDIICRHWAPVPKKGEPSMPSWVSLITGSAFGEPEAALQGRSNGDSLVGTPSRRHQKNYNASAGLEPFARFGRYGDSEDGIIEEGQELLEPVQYTGGHTGVHGSEPKPSEPKADPNRCNGSLSVKGRILDTIGQLSPRAAQGMIFQESLEMGGWTNANDLEKVPESLWRTLVANSGPGGRNAPSWYYRACLECLARVTQNGDLNTTALIEAPDTPSTMASFLKRVQQVVWNRKFLQSKGGFHQKEENKLFGLAPTMAKAGDQICILFGCSVPVILREARTISDVHYTFIGEAYIHGMMDGEALPKEIPEYPYDDYETFKIR